MIKALIKFRNRWLVVASYKILKMCYIKKEISNEHKEKIPVISNPEMHQSYYGFILLEFVCVYVYNVIKNKASLE